MTREEALEMTVNAEIECGILNTYGHPAPEALLSSLRATIHRLVRALPVYPAGQVQVSAAHYEKARALMDIWPMAKVGLLAPREDKDVYLQRILESCVKALDGTLSLAPTYPSRDADDVRLVPDAPPLTEGELIAKHERLTRWGRIDQDTVFFPDEIPPEPPAPTQREALSAGVDPVRLSDAEAAATAACADIARLTSRCAEFMALLRRLREWDHMDTAADGSYWRGEIDRALLAAAPATTDAGAGETACMACGGSGIAVNPSGGDMGGCTDCLGTGRANGVPIPGASDA